VKYFLELSYNGANYHGWQRQNNASSVQEEIETALSNLLSEELGIIGCGRTDTGVHAQQYFAHFDFSEIENLEQLKFRLNAYLQESIVISRIHRMDDEAHARFSATERAYQYKIAFTKDPFNHEFQWRILNPLNIQKMKEACTHFIGKKDFKAFCKQADEQDSHICDLKMLSITETENGLLIEVRANRFMRNMVRAIVGTLVDVGRNQLEIEDLIKIIKSGVRSQAGASAPAKALFLTNIVYPKELFKG